MAMANTVVRQITSDTSLFDTSQTPLIPRMYESKVMDRQLFKLDPRFSAFDEFGVPTQTADGRAILEEDRAKYRAQMKETASASNDAYVAFFNWVDQLLTNKIFKNPSQIIRVPHSSGRGEKEVNVTAINNYVNLVGGVALVQKVGEIYRCDLHVYDASRPCYTAQTSKQGDVLLGTEKTTMVKYDDDLDGYTIIFKTGTSREDVSNQLDMYRGIKQSYVSNVTREVTIKIPLYAYNIEALGMLNLLVSIDISGLWYVTPTQSFVPYSVYYFTFQKVRLWFEVLLCILFGVHTWFTGISILVQSDYMTKDYFKEPPLVLRPPPMSMFERIVAAMSIIIFWLSVIIWLTIAIMYHFGIHQLDYGDTIEVVMKYDFLLTRWNQYSSLNVINAILMTIRVFNYLHFQEDITHVVQVFSKAGREFMNFFMVLAITVFGFGFSFLFIFGPQYSSLSNYVNMVLHIFSMAADVWRPSEAQFDSSLSAMAYTLYFLFAVVVYMMLLKVTTAIVLISYRSACLADISRSGRLQADISMFWKQIEGYYFSSDSAKRSTSQVIDLCKHPSIVHLSMITYEELRNIIATTDNDGLEPGAVASWVISTYGEGTIDDFEAHSDLEQEREAAKRVIDNLSSEELHGIATVLRGLSISLSIPHPR